ncbi:MAG: glycerate kinase [Marinifilaceae bacterium]
MRILIAPNAFKGSLSAAEVAATISRAFHDVEPNFDCCTLPVADGGDGTAEVLAAGLNARKQLVEVENALGRKIKAPLYLSEDGTAFIELADAAGLKLLSTRELAPLQTHTYGVGELIRKALDYSCTRIVLGIGGSATLDVGIGALRALGVRFKDASGGEVRGGGGALNRIASLDVSEMDKRLNEVQIQIACDVDNYLLGERGAAHVFGPQKGANPFQVELLEKNHRKFTQLVKQTLDVDMGEFLYGGAAGGISAGLKAFCGAELLPGADLVLDSLDFDRKLKDCDLVITGEGRIDEQSIHGKAPYVVAQRAKFAGKKVIGLAGSFESLDNSPFDALFSIPNGPVALEEVMENAEKYLYYSAKELGKLIKALS